MEIEKTNELPITAGAPQFRLQKAAIDWSTYKTQMTTAAAVTGLAAFGLHSHQPLVALNAFLTAQVTSEIAGRFGNRLGCAPAFWAAVLVLFGPAVHGWRPRLCTALCLFTIGAYLRYRSTNEKLLLRAALLSFGGALVAGIEAFIVPFAIVIAEFALPTVDASGRTKRRPQSWIAVMLFFLIMSFVATAGRLAPHLVPMLHLPLATIWLRPNPSLLWAGASALLPTVLLPVAIPLPRNAAKVMTLIGSIALTAICTYWFFSR